MADEPKNAADIELERARLELEKARLELEKVRLEKERLELESRKARKEPPSSVPQAAGPELPEDLDLEGVTRKARLGVLSGDDTGTEVPEIPDFPGAGDPADVEARSQKRLLVGMGVGLAAVILAALAGIGIFASKTIRQLEAEGVEHEGILDVILHFDTYRQDLKSAIQARQEREERARIPIFGRIHIESEPPQADVYLKCIPMDERCNNVGTKEKPQWAEHFIRDEEIGDKPCVQDRDCQMCRDPSPAELADPNFDRSTLCRIRAARCTSGICRVAMQTAVDAQGLFIGTLGGLDRDRKYLVRVEKEGWLPEEYTITASDWGPALDPNKPDSDRSFARRFTLKPDPNAPEEVKKKVEEYLREKLEDEAEAARQMAEAGGGDQAAASP